MSPTRRVVGNPTLKGILFNLNVTGIKPLTVEEFEDGYKYFFSMKALKFPFVPFMTRYFTCILTSIDKNLTSEDLLLAAETINRRAFFEGTNLTPTKWIAMSNTFNTPLGDLYAVPYKQMDFIIEGRW